MNEKSRFLLKHFFLRKKDFTATMRVVIAIVIVTTKGFVFNLINAFDSSMEVVQLSTKIALEDFGIDKYPNIMVIVRKDSFIIVFKNDH